jgi:hypothetical protein
MWLRAGRSDVPRALFGQEEIERISRTDVGAGFIPARLNSRASKSSFGDQGDVVAAFALKTAGHPGPAASKGSDMAPQARPTTSEDSGIIDLTALGIAAQQASGSENAFLAPEVFGPPPAAPIPAPRPARASSRWLVAGLSMTIVVLCVAIAFTIAARSQPTAHPAASPVGVTGTTATTEPTAPSAVADPELPSVAPDPSVASADRQPAASQRQVTRQNPPASSASSRPPSKCPCKPDDLRCHMRCAVDR